MENNGAFSESEASAFDAYLTVAVQPYGVVSMAREDIETSSKSKAEGGTGISEEFWAWSEKQVSSYVT